MREICVPTCGGFLVVQDERDIGASIIIGGVLIVGDEATARLKFGVARCTEPNAPTRKWKKGKTRVSQVSVQTRHVEVNRQC